MITGFNTDIEHEGIVYHVQTEDKGLETPLILSLVYVGGAILASKRAPYLDLVEKGFDVKVLTERLHRQHKLICAAIRAGRIEDLKRMSEKETASATGSAATAQQTAPPTPPPAVTQKASASSVSVVEAPAPPVIEREVPELEIIPGYDLSFSEESYAPQIVQPPPPPSLEPPPVEEAAPPETTQPDAAEEGSEELYLTLTDDEGEFRAGQFVTIKVYVGRGLYGRYAVAGADVTVKVLGTTFRPMIITTRTDENGFAVVRAQLPRFNSGRAAIVIRAVAADEAAELRRIIHQA